MCLKALRSFLNRYLFIYLSKVTLYYSIRYFASEKSDWIFINPERHKGDEIEEIMMHELTHCQQLHSIDIIFAELFCVVFWFNPFVWLLKREVRLNLEYLADNSVLANGKDNKEYQYHLLRLTYRKNVATISNNFNVLPIKKRIKMMNKKETKGF